MALSERPESFVGHTIMGETSESDEHFQVPVREIEVVSDPGLRRALKIQADLAATGGMAAFVQSRRTENGEIVHAGTVYVERKKSEEQEV